MKKFIKNILNWSLFSFLVVISSSCVEEELVEYAQGGFQEVTDPYLQIQTPVVSFQAGTEKYGIALNVINGSKKIDEVNVYSVFTDAATAKQSEPTLLSTYPVVSSTKEIVIDSLTYEDLKAGVAVDGSSLPESDVDLAVGSGWKLTFEGVTPDGTVIPLAGSINVAVLSRFAGIYRAVQTEYYRIGELNPGLSFVGQTRFIGSVDENTFSYNDWWGGFAWTGNSFHFDVNFETNAITVPIIVDGLFSGNRALNCATDAAIFTNVPCAGSNVLIPNDETGKHVIKLTYGYFTDGSGAREFYEVLEKVVD